jgi:hypothetical protein
MAMGNELTRLNSVHATHSQDLWRHVTRFEPGAAEKTAALMPMVQYALRRLMIQRASPKQDN